MSFFSGVRGLISGNRINPGVVSEDNARKNTSSIGSIPLFESVSVKNYGASGWIGTAREILAAIRSFGGIVGLVRCNAGTGGFLGGIIIMDGAKAGAGSILIIDCWAPIVNFLFDSRRPLHFFGGVRRVRD